MKVDRLVSIIMVLLDKNRVGAQELADMFEVSLRTIYRDIEAIGMAGIPVCSTSGVGGGFEIMPGYKVDRKVFSTTDLSAILMGLSSLSGMIRGDELVGALAKVKSFIPPDRAKEIALKANQIHIDLSPRMGNKTIQSALKMIRTALQESKLITFVYADRYGNTTTRTAEPYQLVLKGSRWYVHGYCYRRNDYRLFRISRMSGLRISEERFIPRAYHEPQLDFSNTLEMMHKQIKIRIHASAKERVLDYCTSEQISPDGEEHYLVDLPFIENDYYYNILLSFGDTCECLEPVHIRMEMKRRVHRIAALYDNQDKNPVLISQAAGSAGSIS